MRRIERGRFRPGERIFPKDMAQEFGGSPIPIREALCHLVGRGIVVEQRNKGFSIAPMSSTTLRALYAAHHQLMQTVVARWHTDGVLPTRPRRPWQTFAALVDQVDGDVLGGMQSYLAGRLAIARKFEKSWFASRSMDQAFIEAMRHDDTAMASLVIREFHEECENSSVEIWRLISDR